MFNVGMQYKRTVVLSLACLDTRNPQCLDVFSPVRSQVRSIIKEEQRSPRKPYVFSIVIKKFALLLQKSITNSERLLESFQHFPRRSNHMLGRLWQILRQWSISLLSISPGSYCPRSTPPSKFRISN